MNPLPASFFRSLSSQLGHKALGLVILFFSTLFAVGQTNPWDGMINRSVAVKFRRSDDTTFRDFELVDFRDFHVLVREPGAMRDELIGFPLVEFEQGAMFIRVEPQGNFAGGLEIVNREGNFAEAIPMMRPTIWPLVKFLRLPRSSTNFHTLVEAYFKALIAEERVDEANAIVSVFDFSQIDGELITNVMDVVDLFLTMGREEEAGRLLSRLPLENPGLGLQEVAMRIGRRLREGGFFQQAISIYERIFTLTDTRFKNEALLWLAYAQMELQNFDSARIYLGLVGDIEKRLPEYSLKQLITSKVLFEENRFRDAIAAVSQGVVFSRLGLEWMDELMFTSGRSYESVDRPWVAEKIYEELVLFYPRSAWADRARERLAELGDRDRSNDPQPVTEPESAAQES